MSKIQSFCLPKMCDLPVINIPHQIVFSSVIVRIFKPVANFYLKFLLKFYFIKKQNNQTKQNKHQDMTGSKLSQLRKILPRLGFAACFIHLGLRRDWRTDGVNGGKARWGGWFHFAGAWKEASQSGPGNSGQDLLEAKIPLLLKKGYSGTWRHTSQGFMIRPPCVVSFCRTLFRPMSLTYD